MIHDTWYMMIEPHQQNANNTLACKVARGEGEGEDQALPLGRS